MPESKLVGPRVGDAERPRVCACPDARACLEVRTCIGRPHSTPEMDRACKLRIFEGGLALSSCSASRCKLQRKPLQAAAQAAAQ
eukprot:8396422-Alexandrium_andersonii.AAC.1